LPEFIFIINGEHVLLWLQIIRLYYKTGKTVTKAEVISKISEQTGIDKADVSVSVEAMFSVVKNTLAEGENIYIRGFGSFINKKRARKVARNISKNTAIIIDEHYIPSFKPSKVFIEKVKNSKRVKTPR
jgi:DNA-binding protein HU-beta